MCFSALVDLLGKYKAITQSVCLTVLEGIKMLSDIEIAQNAEMKHIRDIAAVLGIDADELEYYGK